MKYPNTNCRDKPCSLPYRNNKGAASVCTFALSNQQLKVRFSYILVRVFNCLLYGVGKNEPRCEKTGLRGFRPGLTQTGLYSHRRWLGAGNFGFRKKWDRTIRVAKTKALISCAVTTQLICVFVAKRRETDLISHLTFFWIPLYNFCNIMFCIFANVILYKK